MIKNIKDILGALIIPLWILFLVWGSNNFNLSKTLEIIFYFVGYMVLFSLILRFFEKRSAAKKLESDYEELNFLVSKLCEDKTFQDRCDKVISDHNLDLNIDHIKIYGRFHLDKKSST